MINLQTRSVHPRHLLELEHSGVHPLLARLVCARGVHSPEDLNTDLVHLLPPSALLGMDAACDLLLNALIKKKSICIVADYDCDGATACALAVRGLRLLGAQNVDYLVPDRVVDGYGLTPEIAKRVAARKADVLITVDNGIASVEGVREATKLGLEVLITDHHLPGPVLPSAHAIVNPNQPNCSFQSKHLSGVGVMFYVLLGLRAHMRSKGFFDQQDRPANHSNLGHLPANQPKLDSLLPLVALGSVADVVTLDANNRRLVAQGLRRIRARQMPAGMQALFDVCAKRASDATAQDLGFFIGPRINAAGRLADMTLGIECLITQDFEQASSLASTLHGINAQRKSVQAEMLEQALIAVRVQSNLEESGRSAICVWDQSFHEGVVGIVASKIKEAHQVPTFVFASSELSTPEGTVPVLKGSGRSVAGFHLRDALDLISKEHEHLLLRFGGHAMAAGCTILADQLQTFEAAMNQIATQWLGPTPASPTILIDGALEGQYLNLQTAKLLQTQVWGHGFNEPLFIDKANVLKQRILSEKHLSLRLSIQDQAFDAVWFNHVQLLPSIARIVYQLVIDTWSGSEKLKLHIQACIP